MGFENIKRAVRRIKDTAVSGVTAAKKAGIFCIAVPSRDIDTKLYKHADVIVPDLGKVIKLYKNGIVKLSV